MHPVQIGTTFLGMSQSEHRTAVAGEVRAAVARQQVKLDDLSAATGIAKSTLSNKLRGVTEFSVSELIAVAIALDVPARDFIAPDHHKAAS